MASTNIDGSVIVILSEEEARCVFRHLSAMSRLNNVELGLYRKIVRDLKIKGTEYRGHMYDAMDSEGLSGGKDLHPEA